MKKLIFFLLFSTSISAGELHGPHAHGEAELLVQFVDNSLEIALVASAQDLIGYERDPKTAKEKKALRKFDQKYSPFEWIKINPEAECSYLQGWSVSDMFSAAPHKHGALDKTHTHELGLEGHIDFLLAHKYECKSVPEVHIELFEIAPSIKKINLRDGAIDGDISSTITKENNAIKF